MVALRVVVFHFETSLMTSGFISVAQLDIGSFGRFSKHVLTISQDCGPESPSLSEYSVTMSLNIISV